MPFSHDTEASLAVATALVNTVGLDGDALVTLADLDDFLARYPYTGVMRRTPEELKSIRALRQRLRKFWTAADRDEAAVLVNEILDEADARPGVVAGIHRDVDRRGRLVAVRVADRAIGGRRGVREQEQQRR